MKGIAAFFVFCAFSANLFGYTFPESFYKYDKYFKEAEKIYKVPFILLKAIALSENSAFDPNIEMKNKNGTKDYGLMQINTIWLKRFGLTEKQIKHPKINIFVAAKILSDLIYNEGSYNWGTIGKYHSRTPKFKKRWIKRVRKNLITIIKYDKKYNYVIKTAG